MKNRISELRKARRMTQQDLADLLGVTRQTIISLEGGRYNPSILLAFKLLCWAFLFWSSMPGWI